MLLATELVTDLLATQTVHRQSLDS